MKTLFAGLFATLITMPALAEVVSVTPQGFELTQTVSVNVPPKQAYAALAQPSRWWDSEHTFSGNAGNLTLGLKPGGCFCETLKDGGWAEHLRVTWVQPGVLIEMHGGLGPMRSEGVNGVLRWTVKPVEGGAQIMQSYIVGGYLRKGSDYWAPLVDGVLQAQMNRLKSLLETGAPAAKQPG